MKDLSKISEFSYNPPIRKFSQLPSLSFSTMAAFCPTPSPLSPSYMFPYDDHALEWDTKGSMNLCIGGQSPLGAGFYRPPSQ